MTNIGLWIDNLMDRVWVGDSLKTNGFRTENISSVNECYEFLNANQKGWVIIDLQNSTLNLESIQEQFAGHHELWKRFICYFPHAQIQLKREAQNRGIEQVYPRSVFFADSAGIMKKIVNMRLSSGDESKE